MKSGWFVAGYTCALIFIYSLTASGHLLSPDAEMQFRTTQALATRGWTDVEPLEGGFLSKAGPDGKEYAQYGVGMPLMALPFYVFGEVLDRTVPDLMVYRVFWPTRQYHDGTPRAWRLRLGVSFFNIIVSSLLGGLFLGVMLMVGLPRGDALMASLLQAVGTYQWAHSRTFFSEPAATLLLFGSFMLIFSWLRKPENKRLWLPGIAGVLAGFSVLVRKDSALFFPGLCLMCLLPLVIQYIEQRKSSEPTDTVSTSYVKPLFMGAFLAFAGMVLGLVAHFVISWLQWGDPSALGYEDQAEGIQFSTPLLAGAHGFLASAGKGLFWFSPALVLAFIGWRQMTMNNPLLAWGAILCNVPFLIAMCKWQNWAGGWCWGPRHIYQSHIFLALGFAGWFYINNKGKQTEGAKHIQPTFKRVVTWSILAVGAMVQIYGTSQSFIDYYEIYFRQTTNEPTARALYSPGEGHPYFASQQRPDGSFSNEMPISLARVPAPINDSIYIPQNTQWARYREMWSLGLNDFFWLHVLSPKEGGPGLQPVVK
jgi:hypothetical protein